MSTEAINAYYGREAVVLVSKGRCSDPHCKEEKGETDFQRVRTWFGIASDLIRMKPHGEIPSQPRREKYPI